MNGSRRMMITLGVLVVISTLAGASTWDYQQRGDHGPSHWGQTHPQCLGSRQSPLNLKPSKASSHSPLQLEHYSSPPSAAHLENNGHTVKLTLHAESVEEAPAIQGGGLPARFTFAQVHFHWGGEDGQGSEHQVDGQKFPMEMHLVHYKSTFPNLTAAVEAGQSDSLAVLGVFFQVRDTPNPGIAKLVPRIEEIQAAKSKLTEAPLLSLSSLLAEADLSSFYRYQGSLTTPGCFEIVQWTVLQHPISISKEQLEAFRSLQDSHLNPLVDNFRPVQSLGERSVALVSTRGGESGAGPIHAPLLALLLVLLAPLL